MKWVVRTILVWLMKIGVVKTLDTPDSLVAWEIANGAYYNPNEVKIPDADTLLGEEIEVDGVRYWLTIEGDESVPNRARTSPTPGYQPEGFPDNTFWDKITLPDGRVVWKVVEK